MNDNQKDIFGAVIAFLIMIAVFIVVFFWVRFHYEQQFLDQSTAPTVAPSEQSIPNVEGTTTCPTGYCKG
jgi:hypothetical protein